MIEGTVDPKILYFRPTFMGYMSNSKWSCNSIMMVRLRSVEI